MAKKAKGPRLSTRIIGFTVCTGLCFVLLLARVGYLQFVRGQELKTGALEQQTREREITPRRGTIYDTNGKELAISANVDTVVVDPKTIRKTGNGDKVALTLSKVLNIETDKVYKSLDKNSSFEYIKKRITTEESQILRSYISGKDADGNDLSDADLERYDLTGVSLIADSKRYYPYGDLAAQTLGITGSDNQGLEGLELQYDKYLKGTAGKIVKSDSNSNSSLEYEKFYNAQAGNNIVLTIDENVQRIVEKHLEEVYVENQAAKGGCAIVMNPNTGAILALATMPNYNLNEPIVVDDPEIEKLTGDEYNKAYVEATAQLKRNKAVVDVYEPGSTFKLITCAMAMEEHVTTMNDTYNCSGSMHFGGHNIHCWKTAGHGTQTFMKGMVNSCNPVLMQVGAKIGKDKFYNYFELFGFKEKTGLDFPGEAVGASHTAENFAETDLMVSSFGQSFEVTPLQMVAAISSLVNGGTMYKPYLVREIQSADGQIIESIQPQKIRQTVSPETSEIMKTVMETVVLESGSTAAVKGYRVGGKSGTSEKQPRGSGKYIGSFVGVAPIDNPQIICMVILDEPTGENYYGGVITAPAAGGIIKDVMQYYGIEPQYTDEELQEMDTTVPDVVAKTAEDAKKILESFGLKGIINGSGTHVVSQAPAAGEKVKNNSGVIIYLGDESQTPKIRVPDVGGLNLEQANELITNSKLKLKISGAVMSDTSAVVSSQEPAAGTYVDEGDTVVVYVEENENSGENDV